MYQPRVGTQSAPQTFASRSASRVEASAASVFARCGAYTQDDDSLRMGTEKLLVQIERPFRAYISQVILTQGFTLGFDGVAPSGLEPVPLT
jgi:hypothetical protein